MVTEPGDGGVRPRAQHGHGRVAEQDRRRPQARRDVSRSTGRPWLRGLVRAFAQRQHERDPATDLTEVDLHKAPAGRLEGHPVVVYDALVDGRQFGLELDHRTIDVGDQVGQHLILGGRRRGQRPAEQHTGEDRHQATHAPPHQHTPSSESLPAGVPAR